MRRPKLLRGLSFCSGIFSPFGGRLFSPFGGLYGLGLGLGFFGFRAAHQGRIHRRSRCFVPVAFAAPTAPAAFTASAFSVTASAFPVAASAFPVAASAFPVAASAFPAATPFPAIRTLGADLGLAGGIRFALSGPLRLFNRTFYHGAVKNV
jgi:hypothetical protein